MSETPEAPDENSEPTGEAEEKNANESPEATEQSAAAAREIPMDSGDYDFRPDPSERMGASRFDTHLGLDVRGVSTTGAAAIGHGAVAYSFNFGTGKSLYSAQHYAAESVAEILDDHVVSPSDNHIDYLLRGRSLVCLVGEPGTGRKHAALAALARRNAKQIYRVRLDHDGALQEIFRVGLIEADSGYLILHDGAKCSTADVKRLELELGKFESYAVLLGQESANPVLDDRQVDFEPPNPAKVFEKQVRIRIATIPCSADCGRPESQCGGGCYRTRLSSWCRDSSQIRDQLHRYSIQQVRDMAEKVTKVQPSTRDELYSLIDADRYRALCEDIRDVFTADADISDNEEHARKVAYLVSYAVFEGCEIDLVHDAAAVMWQSYERESRAKPIGFGETVQDLIPQTICPPPAESAMLGKAKLATDDTATAVLDVAWEYPSGRDTLMSWLDNLVGDDRAVVRRRGAEVAAYFAATAADPKKAMTQIREWARSKRARSRHAAAAACCFLLGTPQEHQVTRWIAGWARSGNGSQRDTVARAYGSTLGAVVNPKHALSHLDQVVRYKMQLGSPSIPMALEQLTRAGAIGEVVARLREWMDDDGSLAAGQSARLTKTLAELPVEEPGSGEPLLLRWIRDNPKQVDTVAALWRHSLLMPFTAFASWRALGEWASVGLDDAALAEDLYTLLQKICNEPAMRDRLGFYLWRDWWISTLDDPYVARIARLAKGEDHAMAT